MDKPAELLDRARALVAPIAERAAAAERASALPTETVTELAGAGLFDVLVPAQFGGHEQSPGLFVEVVKEIARGCGSSAWMLALLGFHNWLAARTVEDVRRRFFVPGQPSLVALTLSSDGGAAARVSGGYRLSGRWSWLTAIHHANRVALTARVAGAPAGGEGDGEGDGGALRVMLVQPEQVTIRETWQMLGMCATGSHSVDVEDVFVAERDALRYDQFFGDAPADAALSPLYHLPMLPLFACTGAAPALGIAEAALAAYERGLHSAARAGKELRASAVVSLAQARVELDAADALLARALAEMAEYMRRPADTSIGLEGGRPVEPWTAAAWRLQASQCVAMCRGVVQRLFESGGLRAHHREAALQRAFRDLSTLGTHVAFDRESAARTYAMERLKSIGRGKPA